MLWLFWCTDKSLNEIAIHWILILLFKENDFCNINSVGKLSAMYETKSFVNSVKCDFINWISCIKGITIKQHQSLFSPFGSFNDVCVLKFIWITRTQTARTVAHTTRSYISRRHAHKRIHLHTDHSNSSTATWRTVKHLQIIHLYRSVNSQGKCCLCCFLLEWSYF